MNMGNGLLIVEDEGVVALDLQTSLESLGYRVLGVCANADDAVRRAEADQPDLVLMDIHLDGDVPGTEAARVIRERFQIPSIFLTAYAEDDMLRNAEVSAPYGYLLKPYQLRELNASVRMGLARRRAEVEEQRQRRRLRMAVEAARLGVWEWGGAARRDGVGGGVSGRVSILRREERAARSVGHGGGRGRRAGSGSGVGAGLAENGENQRGGRGEVG